jgi:hypothetical protein
MMRNAKSRRFPHYPQLPNGHRLKSVWTQKSREFRQRISINPGGGNPQNILGAVRAESR